MSKKEIGSIPQIAQKIVNHLPKDLNDQLKGLITRAEAGQNVTTEIIDLFSQHEITRLWLKEQLNLESREMGGVPGFTPLAGNSTSIPISQKWICPKNEHDHWMFVIQEGEDPPICEKHNIEMVRGNDRKGQRYAG